jgi:hypothetical protein
MTGNKRLCIRRGSSTSPDPVRAATELYDQIVQPEISLALFFCSADYDREVLGRELGRLFNGTNLIGCTTAGEISPAGYLNGTLTGVSIAGQELCAATGRIDHLRNFELSHAQELVQKLILQLEVRDLRLNADNTFGFLMIDGLCMQEEAVVSVLSRSLGNLSLIGGSAGDGVRFKETSVYHDGKFHTDSAVFTLVCTSHPFEVFKTEHFVSADQKMVVTEADCSRRIVSEINGYPAGREYARLVGLEMEELSPMIFANYPVVVRIGGDYYVRSIQKVNDDESLTFFCAIDEGIVLTVGKGVDIIENLEDLFRRIRMKIGDPQLVLGCDCILRHLELDQKGIKKEAGAIFMENNVIGFSTYGEQINAMHVNQTFTGVAIGALG